VQHSNQPNDLYERHGLAPLRASVDKAQQQLWALQLNNFIADRRRPEAPAPRADSLSQELEACRASLGEIQRRHNKLKEENTMLTGQLRAAKAELKAEREAKAKQFWRESTGAEPGPMSSLRLELIEASAQARLWKERTKAAERKAELDVAALRQERDSWKADAEREKRNLRAVDEEARELRRNDYRMIERLRDLEEQQSTRRVGELKRARIGGSRSGSS
jgi:chromosome segregation ATPase